jgi:predicted nucleic acid-binding protein
MFWDSSSLIPLILPEARSAALTKAFNEDRHPVIWWVTPVECQSALARVVREKHLPREQARRALERLSAIRARANEIAPSDDIRARAIHLLGVHALRAADALQLAAALAWCEGQPGGELLVCTDRRLSDAARQEGFELHDSAGVKP